MALWFNPTPAENSGRPGERRTRRRRQWSRVAAIGLLCAHCLLAADGPGGVAGSVMDDSGHAVAGARVLISHAASIAPPIAAPPVITGALAAAVVADAGGSFQAGGLAPGQYVACAEATAPGYLDPCHWSASAPNFTVSAGQTASGVKIVMAKGAVLWVQVDDPRQLLKPVSGQVDLDFEVHVVTSKGVHHGVPIQSSTATGRSHAITIPFDTSVSVRVLSAHLAVSDPSGKSLGPIGATANVAAGTTPPIVRLTVTGTK